MVDREEPACEITVTRLPVHHQTVEGTGDIREFKQTIQNQKPGAKVYHECHRKLLPDLNHLFEDVAVSPLVLLAVHNDRDIPGPHIGDVLPVLLVGVVELGELVALPVGGNVKGGSVFLTTDQEDTPDDALVVLAVDGLSTKEILARSLKTGMETTCRIESEGGPKKGVL